MTATILGPGVYHDLAEADYHAHPALSHSGAKTLMPPGCPALFAYQREHGRPDKTAYDLGNAAHKTVLGTGWPTVVVEGEWRSKDAKAAVAEARANGVIPLHQQDWDAAQAMAGALRRHPLASMLLSNGKPEASMLWRDQRADVLLRGRVDWLRDRRDPLYLVDYKTAESAEPDTFARAAARYHYHSQAAFYIDGAKTCDLSDDVRFLFIVQEKNPPYLVSVVELDSLAIRAGRAWNRRAIDLFAACHAADDWPGYTPDDPALVSLPRYATFEQD